MAAGELIIGGIAYFTLSGVKPSFGIFLLGINADSLGPLIAVAAALVAAQVTKYITKEPRALRFMESAMAGVTQYFIWFALFVGLLFLFGIGGSTTSSHSPSASATPLPTNSASPAATAVASPSSSASPSATSTGAATITEPVEIAGLALIDIISFVGAYYLYPPLYKRMRVKPPPPRTPRQPKEPKPDGPKQSSSSKSIVDRMDEASAPDPKPKDPTP